MLVLTWHSIQGGEVSCSDSGGIPMEYKIKRGLTGTATVHISCPKCRDAVNFDLTDAGSVIPCPNCGSGIRVPGEAEKRADEEEAQRRSLERQEKTRASAQEQRTRQAAQREKDAEHLEKQGAKAITKSRLDLYRHETDRFRSVGIIFVCLGFVIFVVCAVLDPERNLAGLFVGAALFFAGTILGAIAAVGREVHKWGEALYEKRPHE